MKISQIILLNSGRKAAQQQTVRMSLQIVHSVQHRKITLAETLNSQLVKYWN